jgi:hypothetical protein
MGRTIEIFKQQTLLKDFSLKIKISQYVASVDLVIKEVLASTDNKYECNFIDRKLLLIECCNTHACTHVHTHTVAC